MAKKLPIGDQVIVSKEPKNKKSLAKTYRSTMPSKRTKKGKQMGLKEVFQNAAENIVASFGNVATTGLAYHSLGTFSYVAATGVNTESGYTDTTITAIFDEISSDEIGDRDILMTDQKLLVANNDISVTPKVRDYVTINSEQWNVNWLNTDPARALYEIFVRKT